MYMCEIELRGGGGGAEEEIAFYSFSPSFCVSYKACSNVKINYMPGLEITPN